MRIVKFVLLGSAIAALSACGGGGGGGGTSSSVSFNSLMTDARSIYNSNGVAAGDVSLTPVASMPSNGQATYTGTATYDFNSTLDDVNSADAAARVRMQANFSDGTMTGTVSEFAARPNHVAVSGNVQMSGVIRENIYAGSSTGTISRGGLKQDLSGGFVGVFYGSGAKAIGGVEEGTLDGVTPYSGTHIADR